jgi:hypothetical protein
MPLYARQLREAVELPDAPNIEERTWCGYRVYKARAGRRVLYIEAVRDNDWALCAATFQRFHEFSNDTTWFGMPFVEPLLAKLRASRPKEGVFVARDSSMSQIEPERPCTKYESKKRKRESTTPPASAATLRTPASLPTVAQDVPRESDSAWPSQAACFAQVDSPQHQQILAQFRKPYTRHGIYAGRIGDE